MDEKGNILVSPDMNNMKSDLFGISVTDKETREVMKEEYSDNNLLLEPHGAVAWKGLNKYLRSLSGPDQISCISVETAHPAKFANEIRKIIGIDPVMPLAMQRLEEKEEYLIPSTTDYISFREMLKLI
jgi:threonine synthase